MTEKKTNKTTATEEPYERDDFLRDLKKASRKLAPGEDPDPPKRPRPSERSAGKS